MSEALNADLNTPAPAEGDAAPAAAAPAAAAPADTTLNTPEPVQGEEAAAPGQGDDKGAAGDAGQSESQGTDGKKDGEAETSEDDAPQGAPEAYADFTMPEGFTLDGEFSTELTTLAKELNLPQDKAQRLIDLGVKHAQGITAALQESVTNARKAWADEVRADAEIGGANLGVHMATAKKALAAFGTPALAGLLNQTGFSQHPEFLRLLVRVGEAISEDTEIVTGGGADGGRAPKDHAKRLYPNLK